MPKPARLPRVLARLAGVNAVRLADATFHRDVDTLLLTSLGRVVRRRREAAAAAPQDVRQQRGAQLLCEQVERLQIRAVELIQENKVDRAIEELNVGHELLMLLMDWSPAGVDLDLHLGYLYKTLGQAFSSTGDREHTARYLDLAESMFERVQSRPAASLDATARAGAINGLGNVYAERGEVDRALEMYRAAADLAPTYAYAWHDMFAALDQKARAGEVDVPAMRLALENAKRTGRGIPGLSATYLAELEERLARWAAGGRRVTPGSAAPAPRPRRIRP
jgi:tetratricopeptide (TPR) repeat protein